MSTAVPVAPADLSSSGFSAADFGYMTQALRLAERGLFTTQPNPRVGCVVVREGVVVGWGFHIRTGEPHAEVYALREAGAASRGATAYVTLEPCAHTGRTPPCANALIEAGVARVVVATLDANPLVAGTGVARLRAAGIRVDVGLLEVAAQDLNIGFLRRMAGGLPWLRVKSAASLDGRTAMASGESKWITGISARRDVQRWRARSCAIVTGIGTVRADDPELTLRNSLWLDNDCPARQPLRVVLDSGLRLALTAQVVTAPGKLWVVTTNVGASGADVLRNEDLIAALQVSDPARAERAQALHDAGAHLLGLPAAAHGHPDLHVLMRELAGAECNEVLVEAGAGLVGSFLQAGLVDELVLYQAMTLLGSSARPMADWPLALMSEQQRFRCMDLRHFSEDIRMILRPDVVG